MKPLDWRFLSRQEAADLHDAEAARWLAALHWDTRATLARVEAARHAGALPGQVARDAQGAIHGWTFYLVHEGAMQIGAFVADSPEATRTLLDGIAGAPEAATASAAMCFVFSTAPDLAEQLAQRGFSVERYRYLRAALPHRHASRPGVAVAEPDIVPISMPATWEPAHYAAVAALLGAAYAADAAARPFAPGGTAREWLDYVTQLVTATACGTFLPEASFLVPGSTARALDGATLVTRLTADTAHLAQIAVAPQARGRGLARRLLAASLAAAHAAGHVRATLLVSERNEAASRLYQELGFEQIAAFVSAVRDQPRRSSSAEFDTGGAMTLR